MLDGKTALVTGASRGIGRAIATLFSEQGCFVGINYHTRKKEAQQTLQMVKDKGSSGMLLQADISDDSSVSAMIKDLVNQQGRIDILVNNAGIYVRNRFEHINLETWNKVLGVNLNACFNICQKVLPYMGKKGRILFISSQLAFKGTSHGADYATSKAGMLGLMRSLAIELASIPIYVNAVAPGVIDTDIIAHYSPQMRLQRINEIPLKRLGTPIDVASACLFLVSDLSNYITGETIHVNGGLYIH
jgi:3-oxoacyl-[acyl-carrier protein] reductase